MGDSHIRATRRGRSRVGFRFRIRLRGGRGGRFGLRGRSRSWLAGSLGLGAGSGVVVWLGAGSGAAVWLG